MNYKSDIKIYSRSNCIRFLGMLYFMEHSSNYYSFVYCRACVSPKLTMWFTEREQRFIYERSRFRKLKVVLFAVSALIRQGSLNALSLFYAQIEDCFLNFKVY